jgi:hypothetical protein
MEAAAKRRFVGIDLGKRTWTMAIITRTGKMVKNEWGEEEPEEKTVFYEGKTTAEGRIKLYGKLREGDKIARTKVRLRRGTLRSSW